MQPLFTTTAPPCLGAELKLSEPMSSMGSSLDLDEKPCSTVRLTLRLPKTRAPRTVASVPHLAKHVTEHSDGRLQVAMSASPSRGLCMQTTTAVPRGTIVLCETALGRRPKLFAMETARKKEPKEPKEPKAPKANNKKKKKKRRQDATSDKAKNNDEDDECKHKIKLRNMLASHCTEVLQWVMFRDADKSADATSVAAFAELVTPENVAVGARAMGIGILQLLTKCFNTVAVFDMCTIRAISRHTVATLRTSPITASTDMQHSVQMLAGPMAPMCTTNSVFLASGLLNHGCLDTRSWVEDSDVNVMQYAFFDADNQLQNAIIALRDIPQGAELVTCYVMPHQDEATASKHDTAPTSAALRDAFLARPCVCKRCRTAGHNREAELATVDIHVMFTTMQQWAAWRVLFRSDWGLALRDQPHMQTPFWRGFLAKFEATPHKVLGLDGFRLQLQLHSVPPTAVSPTSGGEFTEVLWTAFQASGLGSLGVDKLTFKNKTDFDERVVLAAAAVHFCTNSARAQKNMKDCFVLPLDHQMMLFGQGRDVWWAWLVYMLSTVTAAHKKTQLSKLLV